MSQKMSAPQSDEELYQLSKEELVKIIQALRAELERLKEIVNKDSKSSSKPPSQDIIKKSEKKKSEQQKCLAHMRRHFKNLSKSPVLPNQEIASVFIGLIDDLFPNYHQLQISNDIETYKQWAFKFKKRKISGGSRSLERFGDTANLLTVVQTCRSQKRSVIDFLASAIKAHTRNQIIFPSIIPCSAT
jgi:uncharacterized small protein (DUF1192 family)